MMWEKSLRAGILIFLFIIVQNSLTAQIEDYPDTLRIDSSHQELKMIVEKKDTTVLLPVDSLNETSTKVFNPQKTWWYSAILPGLGQAFNRKYWKIPIIYSVFAGTLFMIGDNNFKYKIYRDAYIVFPTEGPPAWSPTITEDQLKDRKDFYKRNRDFNIIITALVYLMNILDAKVDADLMDFDISDDLSLHVAPQMEPIQNTYQNTFGLKFVLSLNKVK